MQDLYSRLASYFQFILTLVLSRRTRILRRRQPAQVYRPWDTSLELTRTSQRHVFDVLVVLFLNMFPSFRPPTGRHEADRFSSLSLPR